MTKKQQAILHSVSFTRGVAFGLLLSAFFMYANRYDSDTLMVTFAVMGLAMAVASLINQRKLGNAQ